MPPRLKRTKRNERSPSPPDADIEAVRETTRRTAGLPRRTPAQRQRPILTASDGLRTKMKEARGEESSLSEPPSSEDEKTATTQADAKAKTKGEPVEEVLLTRAQVPIRRAAKSQQPQYPRPKPTPKRTPAKSKTTQQKQQRKLVERAASDVADSVLDQIADGYASVTASSDSDHPTAQHKLNASSSNEEEDSEDAFEEVDLSAKKRASAKYDAAASDEEEDELDLTLARAEKVDLSGGKPKKRSAHEQQIRARTHYLSLLCQVAHGAWINTWCNDAQLHAAVRGQIAAFNPRLDRLLAKTARQAATSTLASETLYAALGSAARWFGARFQQTRPGLRKKGYRPASYFDSEADYDLYKKQVFQDPATPDWAISGVSPAWEGVETFSSKEAFIQRAKLLAGSRDYGAHLFTALLRAYHFRCRHVFSTQPLGFKFNPREEFTAESAVVVPEQVRLAERNAELGVDVEAKKMAPKPATPGSAKRKTVSALDKTGGTTPPPPVKKKKMPGSGRRSDAIRLDTESLSSAPASIASDDNGNDNDNVYDDEAAATSETETAAATSTASVDDAIKYPIFWTEVFDRSTQTWFAVDALCNRAVHVTDLALKKLQPAGPLAAKQKRGMGLVVAYDANKSAKDVTLRYAASRARLSDAVMRSKEGAFTRFDAHRALVPLLRSCGTDPADAAEATLLMFTEKAKPKADEMPTTLSGFQRHPVYMLGKHLREKEAFVPGAEQVGTFLVGKTKPVSEPIYRRKDVVAGKTVENYHKEGREVKPGEQPLKLIKQRAMTTARIRELQQYEQEHGTPMMQPIYALDQTRYIVPPPIVDGVIPKNAYGNADVFVPSMVPEGAVHLPYKGMARVAKRFAFDWAEAVVGFEFKKRGAIPLVRGVLVAEEHAAALMAAFEEDEAERVKKADLKREKAALGRWKKMLAGLRIKARIQAEYGTGNANAQNTATRTAGGSMSEKKTKSQRKAKAEVKEEDAMAMDSRGGY